MNTRVGLGTDLHRLLPGDGLWIGGIQVPCTVAAQAVSDGDVLLHALVDALLGAAGQGDIGEFYPESKVAPGEASSRFVRETLSLLQDKGFRLVNVDAVIDLEKPKLAEWKPKICRQLAALLGLDLSRINVKAKTGEGLGPVGAGQAISAQVVVLMTAPQ